MVRTLKKMGVAWSEIPIRINHLTALLTFTDMAYDSVQYDAKNDDNYCTNKNNPVCLRHH